MTELWNSQQKTGRRVWIIHPIWGWIKEATALYSICICEDPELVGWKDRRNLEVPSALNVQNLHRAPDLDCQVQDFCDSEIAKVHQSELTETNPSSSDICRCCWKQSQKSFWFNDMIFSEQENVGRDGRGKMGKKLGFYSKLFLWFIYLIGGFWFYSVSYNTLLSWFMFVHFKNLR